MKSKVPDVAIGEKNGLTWIKEAVKSKLHSFFVYAESHTDIHNHRCTKLGITINEA